RRRLPDCPAPRLELGAVPALSLRLRAIERLIVNLVENALRHGGGDVVIATRRTGDSVILAVLDRGPGIPSTEVERLLQPFTRLNAARSTPGAGLGLAIADRIARLHGGRIELLPRPGGGTEARVTFPAATGGVALGEAGYNQAERTVTREDPE
ncbi:MAG TPA: ATP-binding protein, partial [Burkholderiales bacterium]|nr:ATP-binding protein [Burkholderiales bacterium]